MEIGALALLTLAAALGSFSLATQFVRQLNEMTPLDKVTSTVGVTGLLSALGLVLERNGIAAAVLLLLISWLVYDTAKYLDPSKHSLTACAWLSLALLFLYIDVAHR